MANEKQEKKEKFYEEQIMRYETQFENDMSSSLDPKYAKDHHYLARAKIEFADLLDEDKFESKRVQREQAIGALTTAVNLEETDYHQMWNYHLLARVKTDLREFDIALAYINTALAFPSDVQDQHAAKWNYHLRGRIYLELQLYDSARDDIERSKNIDMLEYETYVLEQRLKQEINL